MATIKVNSEVMRSKSTAFNTVATSVEKTMQEISTEVNNLRSVWEGDDMESTVRLYQSYEEDFENIVEAIRSYATFLDSAAIEYDRVHNQNKTNAEGSKR